jgi:FkbM family methyltransferase
MVDSGTGIRGKCVMVQAESWQGKTASLVLDALAEATRLLGRVPGLPFWPGGNSAPEEGGPTRPDDPAFIQAIAVLPQPEQDKVAQIGREANIMRILRSPAYKTITQRAGEIDQTFAMLADETSVATLEWALKFRLLMQLYPADLLNDEFANPVSPAERRAARAHVAALEGLPKNTNPWVHVAFWGLGRYSLPNLCPVEPGDIVIEAGAERGESTLYLSDLCGPKGHVHAFEFFPDAFARLTETLALNKIANVTTVCKALWNYSGEFPARFSRAGTRLLESDARGDAHVVPAVSIDDYCAQAALDHVDFIKIDANGGQPRIIAGARQTAARCRPRFAVTIHYGGGYYEVPKAFREYLPEDYKFYLRHYSNIHRYTILYAAPAKPRHAAVQSF